MPLDSQRASFISMTAPLVSVHIPALLFKVFLEQGLSADALLEGTGLRQEHFCHPDTLLSYEQLAIITSRGLRLSGNPRIGLLFGTRLRYSHLAELGAVYASAPTLAEAQKVFFKHQRILGSAVDMRLVEHPTHFAIIASKLVPLGERYFFNQESWIAGIANMMSIAFETSVEALGLEVEFDFKAPADTRAYHALFGERVKFGQRYSQVLVPRELALRPLPGACPTQFKLATQLCEEASARSSMPISLPEQIRVYLRKNLEDAPSVDDVAEHLNLSVRTLNRRLTDLSSNFRSLFKEVRSEAAGALLHSTSLPIAIVAQRTGFSNTSNFVNAFRDWTGTTPQRYREGRSAASSAAR
ncbi:MAG: AraC family transcriptional regulator ligand-binding domain-containing protein [Pseudomonas sp.]